MLDDLGTKLTDKRIKNLEKRLLSIYSQAYNQAIEENERWIKKLASLPEGTPIEKRLAFLREVKKTSGMVDSIASQLAQTGRIAGEVIRGEMHGIYRLNYEYAGYSICNESELNLNFAIYDLNQIAAILEETRPPFTKIAYKHLGSNGIVVQRLGNELAIATIRGESQRKIIERIKKVTGQSIAQAKRIAQTERTRVQSQGRMLSMNDAANMGVGLDKQWSARMIRTREMHVHADGEVVAFDALFSTGLNYPGEPTGKADNVINCHCIMKPHVRSVSPELKAHRDRMKKQSFENYEKKRRKES